MRRSQRLIAAAVLISLSGVLAGCADSMSKLADWDPTDMLDFLDTKKKIPGERKPVFPEGVPGLEQGVPKELYKGSAGGFRFARRRAEIEACEIEEQTTGRACGRRGCGRRWRQRRAARSQAQ